MLDVCGHVEEPDQRIDTWLDVAQGVRDLKKDAPGDLDFGGSGGAKDLC